MKHVIAARVLQDTPPGQTGGGMPSISRANSAWGIGGSGADDLEDFDLLAGMASSDTDYRKVPCRTALFLGGVVTGGG